MEIPWDKFMDVKKNMQIVERRQKQRKYQYLILEKIGNSIYLYSPGWLKECAPVLGDMPSLNKPLNSMAIIRGQIVVNNPDLLIEINKKIQFVPVSKLENFKSLGYTALTQNDLDWECCLSYRNKCYVAISGKFVRSIYASR